MFKKNIPVKNKALEWKVWFNQKETLLVTADTYHTAAVIAVTKTLCDDGICVDNTSINVTVESMNDASNEEMSDFNELITVILEIGKPPYWDRRILPR